MSDAEATAAPEASAPEPTGNVASAPDGKAAPESAPEQKPGESDTKYMRRIAELERAQRMANKRAADLEAEVGKYKPNEEALKSDPLSVLEKYGWDNAKLSDALLERLGTKPKPEPAEQALTRIEQLEKQLAERDAAAAKSHQDAQVQRQREHLKDWASRQGEAYSGIVSLGLEGVLHQRVMARREAEGLRGQELDQAVVEEAQSLENEQRSHVKSQVAALMKSQAWRTLFAEALKAVESPAPQEGTQTKKAPTAPPIKRTATVQKSAEKQTPARSTADRVASAVARIEAKRRARRPTE